MTTGPELGLLSNEGSLARVPASTKVVPLRPGMAVPNGRLALDRPESLLSVGDREEIERSAEDLRTRTLAGMSGGAFRWGGVDIGDCFVHDLRFPSLDVAKTTHVWNRLRSKFGPSVVHCDRDPEAKATPAYPYLELIGAVLEDARGVDVRLLSGRRRPPRGRRRGGVVSRIASSKGASRRRLADERVVLALGPFPPFYRPFAEAWSRHQGTTIVISPSDLPVRAQARTGLHFLPLSAVGPTDEVRDRVDAVLGATAALPLQGTPALPGLSTQRAWTAVVTAKVANVVGSMLRLISGFEEGFETAQGLLVMETSSPLARAAVAAAKRHGVPTTVLQHGVLANAASYAQTEADRVAAWGPADASWFRQHAQVGHVEAVGSPRYDSWVGGKEPLPHLRTVMFASQPFVPHDPMRSPWDRFERLQMALEGVREAGGLEFILKWHPSERRESGWADDAGVPVREVHRGGTRAILAKSQVLLTLSSTVALEGMWMGRPVVFLGPADSDSAFDPPASGAGVRTETAVELAGVLRRLRDDASFREATIESQREYLTQAFTPLDGRASERVAAMMEA